jgi:hypothetical protein
MSLSANRIPLRRYMRHFSGSRNMSQCALVKFRGPTAIAVKRRLLAALIFAALQ